MSFTERANKVRHRIPFAYWLVWDIVLLPFLIWGFASLSYAFGLPLFMLTFSACFDINEAVVKWEERKERKRRVAFQRELLERVAAQLDIPVEMLKYDE